MSQVLHILRKDIRRLWIETVLTLVAFAYFTVCQWLLALPTRDPRWYNETAPVVLLVLCWCFLGARLVHGEPLVGDRQFWVTRPYVWYKLLASKLAFLALFLAVPLFVSDCILLVFGHSSIPPLLFWLISSISTFLIVLLVSVMALAAITPSIGQWLVCVAFGIVIVIGFAMLDSLIPNARVPTNYDQWEDFQAIAFVVFVGAAVVLQYARRERWLSSALIAAGIFTVPIIMVATPYRSIILQTYPSLDRPPFVITFVPKTEPVSADRETSAVGKTVTLEFPLHLADISSDVLLQTRGVSLEVDGVDGRSWQSEWQPLHDDVMYSSRDLKVTLEVPRKIYGVIAAKPTRARLEVAFLELRDTNRQTIKVARSFEVGGLGPCWLSDGGSQISCRSTAVSPKNLLLTVSQADVHCGKLPGGDADDNLVRRVLNTDSSEEPLSPFTIRNFYLLNWTAERNITSICLGTPVTFSTPKLTRSFRSQVNLGTIRLADYSPEPVRFSILHQ